MDIEIIGMSCRFPGAASDLGRFWQLLNSRETAITDMPSDRWDASNLIGKPGDQGKSVTFRGGWLSQIDRFDHGYFQISRREAAEMDPQQRLVLEVGYEALHDAGISPDELKGANMGVYVGSGASNFSNLGLASVGLLTKHFMSGISLAMIANRLSFSLDLAGPSLTVDTACSSAMTALTLACDALRGGTCDTAIVAGVNTLISPTGFVGFSAAEMISPRGISSPFDESADGFVRSEGCGAVVLRRSDVMVDRPVRSYAKILATVANEDGRSSSLTMPNELRQRDLYRKAVQTAGIAPEDVVYVEAHGTGTRVGDPIEARSISATLAGERDQPLPIGSVKGHIGHLETAAGIAGVIKSALCLHNGALVPTANHFRLPPTIDAETLGIRVVTDVEPLPTGKAGGAPVIGVCSYGFGGANGFALLEKEAGGGMASPALDERPAATVLPVSAHYADGAERLCRAFENIPDKERSEAARWAGTTLPQRRHRAAAIVDEFGSIKGPWISGHRAGRPPKLLFAFSGQGSQTADMGGALFERFSVFREALLHADEVYAKVGGRSLIRDHNLAQAGGLSEADCTDVCVALPSIVLTQVALAKLLAAAGVSPDAVIGHSTGEMVAAHVRGTLTLEDLCTITSVRAELQNTMPKGAMAAWSVDVGTATETISRMGLEGLVVVAGRNAERSVTLAGEPEAVRAIVSEAKRSGTAAVELKVQRAYHSHHAAALYEQVRTRLQSLAPTEASIEMISSVAGQVGSIAGEAQDATYWAENIARPVDFLGACAALGDRVEKTVEVSPQPVLSGYLKANMGQDAIAVSSRAEPADVAILRSLGQLFADGVAINWTAVQPPSKFMSIPRVEWQHDVPVRSEIWQPGQRHSAPTAAAGNQPSETLVAETATEVVSRSVSPAAKETTSAFSGVSGYEMPITREQNAYLEHHTVERNVVMPGAGLLSMMLQATGRTTLGDVRFERFSPLWTRGDTTDFKGGEADGRFQWKIGKMTVFSCASDDDADPAVMPLSQPFDMALDSAEPVELNAGRFYRLLSMLTEMGLEGPFQSIRSARIGETTLSADLVCEDLDDPLAVNTIILDGAFQSLGIIAGMDSRLAAPVGVERVTLIGDGVLPAEVACFVRVTRQSDTDIVGDIRMSDKAGNPVAHLEGMRLKRLPSSNGLKPQLFQTHWRDRSAVADLDLRQAISKAATAGTALRILDASSSRAVLREIAAYGDALKTVLVVVLGDVPAEAQQCVVSSTAKGVMKPQSFDIVITDESQAKRAREWLSPHGTLMAVEEAFEIPSAPFSPSIDTASPVYFLNGRPEGWQGPVTDRLEQAALVIADEPSLIEASALIKDAIASPSQPRIVFVSRFGAGGPPSPLPGFARAARNENRKLQIYSLMLPRSGDPAADTERLREAITREFGDDLDLRSDGEQWRVPRLLPYAAPAPAPEKGDAFRLEVQRPGQIASMRWRPIAVDLEGLGPNEVRIGASHIALHFKDVMLALGRHGTVKRQAHGLDRHRRLKIGKDGGAQLLIDRADRAPGRLGERADALHDIHAFRSGAPTPDTLSGRPRRGLVQTGIATAKGFAIETRRTGWER